MYKCEYNKHQIDWMSVWTTFEKWTNEEYNKHQELNKHIKPSERFCPHCFRCYGIPSWREQQYKIHQLVDNQIQRYLVRLKRRIRAEVINDTHKSS